MTELITFLSGLVASTLLGAIKKNTILLDRKIGDWIKPVQPFVVLGAAVGLPMLANMFGIVDIPSAEIFAAAPATTLLTVTAREVMKRLKKTQERGRY